MDPPRDTTVIYTAARAAPEVPETTPSAAPVPAPGTDLTPIVVRPSVTPTISSNVKAEVTTPTKVTATKQPNKNDSPSPSTPKPQQSPASPPPMSSVLRPPKAPEQVDPSLPRLRALPVKEFLVSKGHLVVITQSVIASIMYLVSWAITVGYEHQGMRKRHIATVLGFIFQIALITAVVMTLKTEPQLNVLYGLQALSLVTMFLTCAGMGINNVVVDLCSTNRHIDGTICIAHFSEFFAACFVASGMMIVFFAAQQRIAILIDKTVLNGLRGKMTQV
eukprot:GILI01036886.1.p1 GENE.GILI01036886.1~~GILI01036886.1.p1  ORF type:complete len:277 (+),score=38.90 GILI01036886.1:90-920(+)